MGRTKDKGSGRTLECNSHVLRVLRERSQNLEHKELFRVRSSTIYYYEVHNYILLRAGRCWHQEDAYADWSLHRYSVFSRPVLRIYISTNVLRSKRFIDSAVRNEYAVLGDWRSHHYINDDKSLFMDMGWGIIHQKMYFISSAPADPSSCTKAYQTRCVILATLFESLTE